MYIGTGLVGLRGVGTAGFIANNIIYVTWVAFDLGLSPGIGSAFDVRPLEVFLAGVSAC
jgi:hypothetical protein